MKWASFNTLAGCFWSAGRMFDTLVKKSKNQRKFQNNQN